MEDDHDIDLAQKGDREAFARLIHRHKFAMYRIARSYGIPDEDCGDVLQEAIIRAYRSLAQLQERRYFGYLAYADCH